MLDIFQRILYRLRLLDEWQAMLVAFLVGAASTFALAPYHYWWLLIGLLPLFYFVLDACASRRSAMLRGFAFGYGYFMAGTYWIAYALTVDMEKFGWLIPISVAGLSALFALWFAVFGVLYWWRRSGNGFADILRFIVLWVVVEYLRSLGMFGFPWNLLGHSLLGSPLLSQLAALTGGYGLSLLLLLLGMLPVVWLRKGVKESARIAFTLVALFSLIASYGYGAARLPQKAGLSDIQVRVVQPNIPQTMKWTQQGRLKSMQLHAELSQIQTEQGIPRIIIWSETALPFTLYPDSPWPSRLAQLLPSRGMLLTGAVRADDRGKKLKLWNSLIALDAHGQVRATYDKHRLVPFGEFVPLRNVLPLDKITPGDTDFSRGEGARSIRIGDFPAFSPLICYEVIFPGLAVDPAARPAWLLNVTNDAWYGDTPGPYQHFAMSRLRAIEQGLPLVRAANTGISAVIDPYGRAVRSLPLNTRGILDQSLPLPLPATPYARFAQWPLLLLLAGVWIFTSWLARVRKN